MCNLSYSKNKQSSINVGHSLETVARLLKFIHCRPSLMTSRDGLMQSVDNPSNNLNEDVVINDIKLTFHQIYPAGNKLLHPGLARPSSSDFVEADLDDSEEIRCWSIRDSTLCLAACYHERHQTRTWWIELHLPRCHANRREQRGKHSAFAERLLGFWRSGHAKLRKSIPKSSLPYDLKDFTHSLATSTQDKIIKRKMINFSPACLNPSQSHNRRWNCYVWSTNLKNCLGVFSPFMWK